MVDNLITIIIFYKIKDSYIFDFVALKGLVKENFASSYLILILKFDITQFKLHFLFIPFKV